MHDKKNLVNMYVADLPKDPTAMYYIKSFIRNFRTMEEKWVKYTIWHELWSRSYSFTDEKLTSEILNLSTDLNVSNGLLSRVENMSDTAEALGFIVIKG